MQKKKYLLRILVAFMIFVVFFVIGFTYEWTTLTQIQQKCLNREYSNYENSGGPDFNEMYLEIHDNFSVAYKAEYSLCGGLLIATLGTVVTLYVYMLYKLFSSKNAKKISIGYALIAITFVCLLCYYYFITNFRIVF